MINFSNYTIYQQQAMNDVLYDLVERLEDYGAIWDYLREMRAKSDTQLTISVDAQFYQQALAAEDPPVDMKDLEWQEQAAPPTATPTALAEDPDDLRALLDTFSRCSDQLAALALVEERHFVKSSQMEDFLRVSVLRNGNRVVMDLVAEIRDRYYDRLH